MRFQPNGDHFILVEWVVHVPGFYELDGVTTQHSFSTREEAEEFRRTVNPRSDDPHDQPVFKRVAHYPKGWLPPFSGI